MTAATDPRRRRHAIGTAEFMRLRGVVADALARHEALRAAKRFWADWIERQHDRLDQFGGTIWLSDRELEIVAEIGAWLETASP